MVKSGTARSADTLSVNANVRIQVWDVSTPELETLAREGRGKLLSEQEGHNLVVLAGRNLVRDLLAKSFLADATVGLTHFAFGSGSTAINDSQTALVTETLRQAILDLVKGSSNITAKFFLASTQLNSTTIREAGLFNAGAAGTMFARYLLAPSIVKDNTVAVTFTWVITMSAT